MPSNTYYPNTTEGRRDWWANIKANSGLLTTVGFSAGDVTAVGNDADWGIYVYGTIRQAYEHYFQSVVADGDTIAHGIGGTAGQALPPAPEPADWPTAPTGVIVCDFETRREEWVQRVKNASAYTESIGETLRIIRPVTPFDPTTYTPQLRGLMSQSPKTVSGKFRKENGNVDGIILYGRKDGTYEWIELGRFNATPFTAAVPLAGVAPEVWEFQARAFKKDVPFGNMSAAVSLTIRG